MKHLLILFSLALVVAGCTIDNNEQSEIERVSPFSYIEAVEYKGHHYVRFYDSRHASISVIHDPDCPCHSKTLTEWQQLQLAIAITESQCNPSATGNTNDGGLLQIRPIYVSEVNRVSGTSYTHKDVYTPASAIDMFNRMQMYYNPEKDISKAIYYHNKSKDYKTKVIRSMEFVKRYENCRKVIVSYGE